MVLHLWCSGHGFLQAGTPEATRARDTENEGLVAKPNTSLWLLPTAAIPNAGQIAFPSHDIVINNEPCFCRYNWVTFPESGNPFALSTASQHQAWRLFFLPTNKPTATILSISFSQAAWLPATTFLQSRTTPDQPVSKIQNLHSLTEPQWRTPSPHARPNATSPVSPLQTKPWSTLPWFTKIHSPCLWRAWPSSRAFFIPDDAVLWWCWYSPAFWQFYSCSRNTKTIHQASNRRRNLAKIKGNNEAEACGKDNSQHTKYNANESRWNSELGRGERYKS